MNGRKQLPISEVEADVRWRQLTPQQQAYVRILHETNDPATAMTQAYDVTDESQAIKGSYALMSRRNVRAVLNFMYQDTPAESLAEARTSLVRELDRERRSRSKVPLASRLRAIELKAQLLGINLVASDSPEEKKVEPEAAAEKKVWKVGEEITVNGLRGHVTVVDRKSGQPTDFDPIKVGA
jgi:hypothetical protein